MASSSHDAGKVSSESGETHVENASVQRKSGAGIEKLDPDRLRANINAKIANPLAGFSNSELEAKGEEYVRANEMGDDEDIRAFRLGAIIAKDPNRHAEVPGLTEEERSVLEAEITRKWNQPFKLFLIIVLCSICAAVQGMDETVVNGAQIFYSKQFGIGDKTNSRQTWLVGLTNSAPYLCCAVIGCWMTIPLNNYFGRRGTVFITCVISAVACIWQAFTNTWWHMFIARFALGFGIGPKSATQMWTAFGIMVGYAADLAFYKVQDVPGITGLNWRLMMGSACFPAIIVVCFVFMCPESPRWYMSKSRHAKAYKSMCKLRYNKVQAARDIFYMHTLLEVEKESMKLGQSKVKEMFTVPRNRRAMQASEIVMFMQQFCGVNVIAYYSSQIFLDADLSEMSALGASMGWGVINFLFAIPAIYTIDTFGRRNLLLTTFPLMSLCLFFAGFSFWIPADSTARVACVALGLYLFGIVYSPGEGPVPFTYSAEAYPLYIRAQGMSLATATTWFFNFILAVTWPSLLKAFKPQGAFAWYAIWNLIGFTGVLFLVPETKGKTLEELDQVFSVRSRDHAAYGGRQFIYFFRKYLFRQKVEKENLYETDSVEHHPSSYTNEKESDATKRV
ncbi:hypothetical protein IFR04_000345 [Cadophora malorum]|uniref:Major facilitator superfamily (MFS) profile domain-containing protein n=1 Tax=Cadophora malorum TaxID=108018 RepID=A0A8H7WK06_9HELO|nr:hypothetical protein IFR04_000345 [Cadophora malorum]